VASFARGFGTGIVVAGAVTVVQAIANYRDKKQEADRRFRRDDDRWRAQHRIESHRWLTQERIRLYRDFSFVANRAFMLLQLASASQQGGDVRADDGATLQNVMEGLQARLGEVRRMGDEDNREAANAWAGLLKGWASELLTTGTAEVDEAIHTTMRDSFDMASRAEMLEYLYPPETRRRSE
jgi:hypothetical protein